MLKIFHKQNTLHTWNIYACIYTHNYACIGGSDGKEFTYHAGDQGSIPGLGRSAGGHGNPLQYSCLKNPRGQRTLVGYSPWGCKELDTTEQQHSVDIICINMYIF